METGTGPMKNCAAGSIPISFTSEEADNGEGTGYYAEIRIVHVGNCMGILCGKVRRCGAESVSVFSFLDPLCFIPSLPRLFFHLPRPYMSLVRR